MSKQIFKGLVVTAVLVGSFTAVTGISQFVQGLSNDKDLENSLPDPNRPYFDACGDQYSYDGVLIARGTGCETPVTQPTTTQPTEEKSQCQ